MKRILLMMVLLLMGGIIELQAQNIVNRIARRAEIAAVRTVERKVGDKVEEPIGMDPMVQKYSIRNGIVTFDEDSFAGQILQGMEVKISGTLFRLPSNAKVGDTFGDYSILINMGGIKTTSHVTNIRVTAEVTI